MDCEVKNNCSHNWGCDFCINYSDYQANDRRIMSPAQEERKLRRKEEKKELKASEHSKRGKRNKRAGYTSEVAMVKKYIKYGYEAERQPMSGSLKGKYAGDIKVYIKGKWRRHEDKKRSSVESFYTRTENQTILYEDFCVVMNEDVYFALLNGIVPEVGVEPDAKVKLLHDFFEQDNSDIVSLRQHGKQKSVYAITINFWKELCEGS